MAEGTYEYECMRAELLGVKKPDFDAFMEQQQKSASPAGVAVNAEDEEPEVQVDQSNEKMGRIAGRLDELNNILQSTQKKITSFKASCGSLTNMLKFKITSSRESLKAEGPSAEVVDSTSTEMADNSGGQEDPEGIRQSDLARALDNHNDRLDGMLEKAENAQYSMAHQNKQMKKFLN